MKVQISGLVSVWLAEAVCDPTAAKESQELGGRDCVVATACMTGWTW